MKIMLLGDGNSLHIIKWTKGLTTKGIEVGLWSITKPDPGIYDDVKGLKLFYSNISQERLGLWAKIKYLTLLHHLRKSIKAFGPDIVHAHFASSYGLLGALVGFRPFIISVWGNDVYLFPTKNFLFKEILKFNLRKADKILSTSKVMARETAKYTKKHIQITPFGIDLDVFKAYPPKHEKVFTIGTVKTLEEKYGIGYLIDAFDIFRKKYPSKPFRLLIVGGGSLEDDLKIKANKLGISHLCEFTGPVPYASVPDYHNQLDVNLCLSIVDSESFGVSAIEASASEKPVIVSNVGGLPEVIVDEVTGIVIPPKNAEKAAAAIERLYLDQDLRNRLGKAGRERVQRLYDWENNLRQMVEIYKEMLRNNER